jgi:hypothetical protein
MAALTQIQLAQQGFLRAGGTYMLPLQMLREKGIIPPEGETAFHHYPKMLRLNPRTESRNRTTKDCEGRPVAWTESLEVYDEIVVASEDEEERVLSGGKTSTQLEEERQGLLVRCRAVGIQADPTWTSIRLRRELGEALDAPPPGDSMATLEAELATLRKMAAMQAEIDALKAQMSRPAEDPDTMRAELATLGVPVDGRWSVRRLREELERATEPKAA